MQLLEQRILSDGEILPGGILKVDGFLNHQMDPVLLTAMAEEFHRFFADAGVNKILTIEASGIGPACFAGLAFGCPVLVAKKNRTRNLSGEFWTSTVWSTPVLLAILAVILLLVDWALYRLAAAIRRPR